MTEVIFATETRTEKMFVVAGPPEPPPARLRTTVVWLPVRFATDPANARTYPVLADGTFADADGTRWQEKSRVPHEFEGDWRFAGVVATRAGRERIISLLKN